MLFEATKFVVVCYSHNRELIQASFVEQNSLHSTPDSTCEPEWVGLGQGLSPNQEIKRIYNKHAARFKNSQQGSILILLTFTQDWEFGPQTLRNKVVGGIGRRWLQESDRLKLICQVCQVLMGGHWGVAYLHICETEIIPSLQHCFLKL